MHPSPCSADISPPASTSADPQPSQSAGRAYQAVTVAVMLWLLASLWLFW